MDPSTTHQIPGANPLNHPRPRGRGPGHAEGRGFAAASAHASSKQIRPWKTTQWGTPLQTRAVMAGPGPPNAQADAAQEPTRGANTLAATLGGNPRRRGGSEGRRRAGSEGRQGQAEGIAVWTWHRACVRPSQATSTYHSGVSTFFIYGHTLISPCGPFTSRTLSQTRLSQIEGQVTSHLP